jgi:transposase
MVRMQISVKLMKTAKSERIPVKGWSWPGNTSDKAIIDEIKSDLNLWDLSRTIYVEDTGFNSEKNRRMLRGAGDHYIIGEKLRIGRNAEVHPALKHPKKFKKLAAIERVFRDMKHLIDIRPVYQRLEQRISSHIPLCWLSMLLIRIAENETGQTWFQMKKIITDFHGMDSTPDLGPCIPLKDNRQIVQN